MYNQCNRVDIAISCHGERSRGHPGIEYFKLYNSIDAMITLETKIDLLQNPTSADNWCVDFVLKSSCISNTLRFCAPKSPSTSLSEASFARGLIKNGSNKLKMQECINSNLEELYESNI